MLRQAFAHCGRFPTAASRRSLGRVSVPMWPFILSDRLLIVALVGLYPHQLANQTQAHLQAEAFSEASFSKCLMRYSYIHSVLAPLSKCCPHLEGRLLTRYSPVRHLVFTEITKFFFINQLCKVNFVYRNFRILQINQAAAISFSSLFFKWELTFCRIILIFISVFCRFCITSIYEVLISFDSSVKIKTSCILPYAV